LTLRDAAGRTRNPLAWYFDTFPEMTPPENLSYPPPAPQPPMVEDPLPQPQLTPEVPVDVEGSESNWMDMWAVDDAYDIWGGAEADDSSDSSGVVSIVESLEIVVISSDESGGGNEEPGERDGANGDDSLWD